MTPLPLLLFALENEPEPAFGRRTTAEVRESVQADGTRSEGDGAYGRFDGDLDLGVGAGASAPLTTGELSFEARASALWFFIAGPYVTYAQALEREPDVERRLGFGIDLRPLFLVRWPRGLERGPAFWDLALDSISLGLGMAFAEPRGQPFGSRQSFELSLGAGIPLLAWAAGPWLEVRGGLSLPAGVPAEANLLAMLSWHFAASSPFVSE